MANGHPQSDKPDSEPADIIKYLKDKILWAIPVFFGLVSGLGLFYEFIFLWALDVDYLRFASTEDFLLAALRHELILLLSFILILAYAFVSWKFWKDYSRKTVRDPKHNANDLRTRISEFGNSFKNVYITKPSSVSGPSKQFSRFFLFSVRYYAERMELVLRRLMIRISSFFDWMSRNPLTSISVSVVLSVIGVFGNAYYDAKFLEDDRYKLKVLLGSITSMPGAAEGVPEEFPDRDIYYPTLRWGGQNDENLQSGLLLLTNTENFLIFRGIKSAQLRVVPVSNISELEVRKGQFKLPNERTATKPPPQSVEEFATILKLSQEIKHDLESVKADITELKESSVGLTTAQHALSGQQVEALEKIAGLDQVTAERDRSLAERIGLVHGDIRVLDKDLRAEWATQTRELTALTNQIQPIGDKLTGVAREHAAFATAESRTHEQSVINSQALTTIGGTVAELKETNVGLTTAHRALSGRQVQVLEKIAGLDQSTAERDRALGDKIGALDGDIRGLDEGLRAELATQTTELTVLKNQVQPLGGKLTGLEQGHTTLTAAEGKTHEQSVINSQALTAIGGTVAELKEIHVGLTTAHQALSGQHVGALEKIAGLDQATAERDRALGDKIGALDGDIRDLDKGLRAELATQTTELSMLKNRVQPLGDKLTGLEQEHAAFATSESLTDEQAVINSQALTAIGGTVADLKEGMAGVDAAHQALTGQQLRALEKFAGLNQAIAERDRLLGERIGLVRGDIRVLDKDLKAEFVAQATELATVKNQVQPLGEKLAGLATEHAGFKTVEDKAHEQIIIHRQEMTTFEKATAALKDKADAGLIRDMRHDSTVTVMIREALKNRSSVRADDPFFDLLCRRGLIKKSVLFSFDSADLKGHPEQILEEIVAEHGQALQGTRDASQWIVVEGHASPKGSSSYNLNLAEERAEAVAADLAERLRINPNLITPISRGEGYYFLTEASQLEEEAMRVQIYVCKPPPE